MGFASAAGHVNFATGEVKVKRDEFFPPSLEVPYVLLTPLFIIARLSRRGLTNKRVNYPLKKAAKQQASERTRTSRVVRHMKLATRLTSSDTFRELFRR